MPHIFVTLILVLIILAAFGLVFWGASRMGIPEPIRTIMLVIVGLIALAFLYSLVAGGGLHLSQ